MSGIQLSWRQHLILKAASRVDYLNLEARRQTNLPNGVWRALVIRGLMREVPGGWQITEKGRMALKSPDMFIIKEYQQRIERLVMDGKLPRYCVTRTRDGWAILDRHVNKIKVHNDVVEMLQNREAARTRCRELNLLDLKEKHVEAPSITG
jgi:hypothetical protein